MVCFVYAVIVTTLTIIVEYISLYVKGYIFCKNKETEEVKNKTTKEDQPSKKWRKIVEATPSKSEYANSYCFWANYRESVFNI